MNEPKFLDPAIERKNLIVEKSLQLTQEGWPLPAVVEISESGTCNRKCSFCPRSDESYPDIQEFIDPVLLTKLVSELSSYGFKGLFLFSGFVEPMIDKNIYELISIVKKFLPKARIEMVTNGDALNLGRIKKLMDVFY
jgi:wyosine [tRNA(Phe)-imidazoG37] synthetase (radical SAM superfamily)